MALSKSGLKNEILTELQAQGFVITGTYAWSQKFAEAVANAVVDHIQANGEITSSGTHVWNTDGSHVHGTGTIS